MAEVSKMSNKYEDFEIYLQVLQCLGSWNSSLAAYQQE